MELFRGYVPTEGKESMQRFKDDTPLPTLEEVQKYPSYAGVLLNGIILVDFDNAEHAERMLEIVRDKGLRCRAYRTTKGMHFYFRNDGKVKKSGNSLPLACGLTADFKVGGRNSYGVLKLEGKKREVIYDTEGEYDILPNFLLPISKKCDVSLLNLGEGDGRNSELFRYIPTLQALGLSKDEIREIGRVINRYILRTPLSENEFSVVFRDEAFVEMNEGGFDSRKFQHNLFGDQLIAEERIIRIDGQLHVYREGVYVEGKRNISQSARKRIPSLKSNQIMEVLKYIDDMCEEIDHMAHPRYIAFNNGIFDVETGVLQDFSPDIIIKNKIRWDYNPEAYYEVTDRALNKLSCNDPEVRSLLEECIGYCFYRANPMNAAFFLTGDGSNGKSTFLKMVEVLLGADNKSSLSLHKLNDRFSTAQLYGKLANIGADISEKFIEGDAVANFKNLTSGDSINAEFKGENPFDFIPYAKLLFSANEMPKMKGAALALRRRMKMVPFDAVFSDKDEDYDSRIGEKLESQESMEYLITIGIEGLRRILKNQRFTESERVNNRLKGYMMELDSVEAFLSEVPVTEIENQKTDEVYSRYEVYCVENELDKRKKTSLSLAIKKKYGIRSRATRIGNEPFRIYLR